MGSKDWLAWVGNILPTRLAPTTHCLFNVAPPALAYHDNSNASPTNALIYRPPHRALACHDNPMPQSAPHPFNPFPESADSYTGFVVTA